MATGNIEGKETFYDTITLNMSEFGTNASGYVTKTMGRSHAGEILVGYAIHTAGISDLSKIAIQPVYFVGDTVYLTYIRVDTTAVTREFFIRLLFVRQ